MSLGRLEQLADRIYDIICNYQYNSNSVSKIYSDIVLTYINVRLDDHLSFFRIDDSFTINTKIADHFKKVNAEFNDVDYLAGLFELIPELVNEIEWCDAEHIYEIEKILLNLKHEFGIEISKAQITEYYKAAHCITLNDEVLRKMTLLCSYYFKINEHKEVTDFTNLLKYKDLPYYLTVNMRTKGFILPVKKLTWEELITLYEINSLRTLIRATGKNSIIKSINKMYKFKDMDSEISNLKEYAKDNDIWKLSRIVNNFVYVDKETKKAVVIPDTKFELISDLKNNKELLNEFDILPESWDSFWLKDRYLDKKSDKLRFKILITNMYKSWCNNNGISDWDTYWASLEKKRISEDLRAAIEINFDKDKKLHDLQQSKTKNNYIPTFADMEDLKPPEIKITVDYSNVGKELTIEIRGKSVTGGFELLDLYSKKGKKGNTNVNYKFLQCLLDPVEFKNFERSDKGSEALLTSRTRQFNDMMRRKFPIGKAQSVKKKKHDKYPEPLFKR